MRNPFGSALALLAVLLGGPSLVAGADVAQPSRGPERWSLLVGGGYFSPAVDGWKEQYGRSGEGLPTVAGSYRVVPWLSLTADAAYLTAEGYARTTTGVVSSERQRLALFPVTLGVEHAVRFSENQLLVPFVGVGYRRVVYRLAVENKDRIQGGAGGWVARGGFDVLLNTLDPSAASGLREESGIARSYLRIEAQRAKVIASGSSGTGDIDLGGRTFLAGLRFEF
ncbi:MAG: hypothetical protein HY207_04060 [Nitrospirae bacterium]|nr:hypothetical protein [Nitrospirota bacterium]